MFWIMLLEGLWCLYNYAGVFYGFPYVSLFRGRVWGIFGAVALKWSPVLGVVFLLYGMIGIIYGKRGVLDFRGKYLVFVVATVASVCLCF